VDAQWKVKRLEEPGEETETLDATAVVDAFNSLEQEVDDCPGNIGCVGANEDHFLVASPAGEVGYVLGPTVVWEGKRRLDAEGKFDYLGRKALEGHAEKHNADAGACQQGRPPDYAKYADGEHWLKNSCMNYAVDHRWNWNPGGARGIHDSVVLAEWTDYLEGFGIEPLSTLPDATDDGWPIALFFKPNERLESTGEFHFLRLLPSGFWAHKFAARRPALCDFSGNAMPKDSLKTANLCGYRFGAYYWVPKGTIIRNRNRKNTKK
jgi:hypothetical protein